MRRLVAIALLAVLALGACASAPRGMSAPSAVMEALPADLSGKLDAFWREMLYKDLASRYSRPLMRPYFATDRALDDFLVVLIDNLQREDFARSTYHTVDIEQVELVDESTVTAEIRLTGEWILWWDTRYEMEQTWVKRDGTWLVQPPDMKDLPL